jgi:subtilase family serine protease
VWSVPYRSTNDFDPMEARLTGRIVSTSVHFAIAIAMASAGLGTARGAVSEPGRIIANNISRLATTGKNLGPAEPSKVIDVSIWLKLHDREALDSLAAELYNPESPKFREWLKHEEFAARFAPTAKDAMTVEAFLSAHGLPVVEVGPNNMFVRARGTIGAVSKAFRVQMSNFELKGKTYFANTSEPFVEGAAAALVASVAGLHNLEYEHPLVAQVAGKKTSKLGVESMTADAAAGFISQNCFTGPKQEIFGVGSFPVGTYYGNSYSFGDSSAGCGYTPQEIYRAYNLTGLYKEGFDGTGQTIVIIDWCGSPTIRQDANTFSEKFGLPALTPSNFHILNSSTPPTCGGVDPEINIDVEWAHAIAPGAAIDLVVPPSASFQDVDIAEFYAIENGLGNVISGSYGSPELFDPPAEVAQESLINEIAAVEGISANFSTGDDGDFTFDSPQFNPATVSAPADSPFATAVGGVTLALKANDTINWQTGWGTNETLLVSSGQISDPPLNGGFFGGSGGGPSGFFAKPWYQSKLKGAGRQLPDISWLADPFTGGVIAISEPFQFPPQIWTVFGGTSLACPMFSALWAIANQEAGTALGQAAPYLYSMPKGTITDVLPYTSKLNVTASINEGGGLINKYSAAAIAAPLEGTTEYYSAIWNVPLEQDTAIVVTFGTDSGLKTTPGYDNVTGLGTPNAQAFADFFK